MPPFTNTDELVAAFGDLGPHFYDVIPLNDTPVGFSIKRKYSEQIRYKPPIRQDDGEPDVTAVLWVVYLAPKPGDGNADYRRVPVRIRISPVSQYLVKHFDYNFSDVPGGSPSRESLKYSLSTPKPIELSFENAFFYNHQLGTFIDKDGRAMSGVDVLDNVFRTHCDTVHFIKGLSLRLKLAWQAKMMGLLSVIVQFITSLLKFIFGRTLDSKASLAGLYTPYPREALKKLDQDSIEIFGYKAAKPVIITFCLLIISLGIYCYSHRTSENYLTWLISQDFLLVSHAIFLVWVLDVAIPWILFHLINGLIRTKSSLLFLKFNV